MAESNESCERRFRIENNVIIGEDASELLVDRGVGRVILDAFDAHPNTVGQLDVETGETMTHAEMKDLSVRCALWLRKQGVGKDDIVASSTPPMMHDFVPMLSTFYVGAVFNPWYDQYSAAECRDLWALMEPKIMIATDKTIDLLASTAKEAKVDCKFVVIGESSEYPTLAQIMAEQSQREVDGFVPLEYPMGSRQTAVVFFSSGTTGKQKGTMLTYEAMVNARFKHKYMPRDANYLYYSGKTWITGTHFHLYTIRNNATRLVAREFEAERACEIIEKHRVRWTFLTPTYLTKMYKADVLSRYDLSSLDALLVGGSRCNTDVLLKFREALMPNGTIVSNSFGMTELGGAGAMQTRHSRIVHSVGDIVERVSMKVLDPETDRQLGPDEEGELCFMTENRMTAYYKNPAATKEVIDDDGWCRSGDLGYFTEDGEIVITSRRKEVIICQNDHVAPGIIEEILLKHPGVADAAVVPVPHSVDVERPMAFVVKTPESTVTAEELIELSASYATYYRLIGGVVFVDSLPYTSTGKIALRKLKEMALKYAQ
ncbi:hypothetical protein TKK_0016370 [Trichogramma kaykai]|uniref:Uncharacterized protein n=1 Tax=Trichogramma kaykai TaxID=54128 RepID=A0ABD2W693_9HYME